MIEQFDEFICPITQQIFLEPVVASDGFTYEKVAIAEWLKTNNTSPITRELLNYELYPNNFVMNKIKNLDENYPFLYTKKYQHNLKNWINYFNKKYNIILKYPFNKLLDDITEQFSTEKLEFSIHSECEHEKYCIRLNIQSCKSYMILDKLTNFNTLADNIETINMCRMPDRKHLYDELVYNVPRKNYISKLIASSSPKDNGLKYFLKIAIVNGSHHFSRRDVIKSLDPKIHFSEFSLEMFKNYIFSIETYDELYIAISEQFMNFDNTFYKYILHYVLRNVKFLKLAKTSYEFINKFKTLITFLVEKFIINLDLHDPFFGSIINSFIGTFHWYWGANAFYTNWYSNMTNMTLSNIEVVHQILCLLKNIGIKWKGCDEEIINILSLRCDDNDYEKIILPISEMLDSERYCNKKITYQMIMDKLKRQEYTKTYNCFDQ
jgi:hypothetical protein